MEKRPCVHADECERGPPQHHVLRVYGYEVHTQALAHQHYTVLCKWREIEGEKKITNPVDALASQGRGQSLPQAFTTLDGGNTQVPRTSTSTQGDAWKGHLCKACQRPNKSKTSIDRGHKGRGRKTINKSSWLYFTRREVRSLHLCSVT